MAGRMGIMTRIRRFLQILRILTIFGQIFLERPPKATLAPVF